MKLKLLAILKISFCVSGFVQPPSTLASSRCQSYKINFSQNNSDYFWSLEWPTKLSTKDVQKIFTENASLHLENQSEVIQSIRWRSFSPNSGHLEAWVLADLGITKSRKFFVKSCEIKNETKCALDTSKGDGGEQLRWQTSYLKCAPISKDQNHCTYQEQGSVKGYGFLASPQKMSVSINVQSMKDTLRLAIGTNHSSEAISQFFLGSRRAIDDVWNQSQKMLRLKQFKVQTAQNCQ